MCISKEEFMKLSDEEKWKLVQELLRQLQEANLELQIQAEAKSFPEEES